MVLKGQKRDVISGAMTTLDRSKRTLTDVFFEVRKQSSPATTGRTAQTTTDGKDQTGDWEVLAANSEAMNVADGKLVGDEVAGGEGGGVDRTGGGLGEMEVNASATEEMGVLAAHGVDTNFGTDGAG